MKDEDVGIDKEAGRVVFYTHDRHGGYITDQSVKAVLLYKILEKLDSIDENLKQLNNKTR